MSGLDKIGDLIERVEFPAQVYVVPDIELIYKVFQIGEKLPSSIYLEYHL